MSEDDRVTDRSSEEAALAFLLHLDPAVQHEVFERFGEILSIPTGHGDVRRLRDVVRALREARSVLGRSPSLREYRELRRVHPEWTWPPERSVVRWLGVRGWNNALVRAGLEAVTDGDVIEVPGPHAYRPEELVDALQECARDLGRVPSPTEYWSWRRRPDVDNRLGRRPRSLNPFSRVFGSFHKARVAAGMIIDASPAPAAHHVIRVAQWGTSDAELLEHIRLVAYRVGGPMTMTRHAKERRAIFLETSASGKPLAIASSDTISRRFTFWGAALYAAGVTGSALLPDLRRPKGPFSRYMDDQVLAILSEAHDDLAESLTCEAYKRWR